MECVTSPGTVEVSPVVAVSSPIANFKDKSVHLAGNFPEAE